MRAKSGTAAHAARARFARRVAMVLLAAVAAGLAAIWFFGDKILETLERQMLNARGRLAGTLRWDHELEFYASLDECIPMELVTETPLHGSGAVRVPGVFGSARRFDGRPGENLVAPTQRWSSFADHGFTLAFRAVFPEGHDKGEHRLVWDCGETTGFGLRLVDGQLEAILGDGTDRHSMLIPAPPFGIPVHIAFSLGTNGATLYVDGAARGFLPVSPPLRLHSHLVAFGTDGHFPPSLDVDEWCVWKRPLDATEIARIASARRPVPELLEPRLAATLRRREGRVAFFRTLLGTIGSLRSSPATPAVFNRALPVLELSFSGNDRRHFRKAYLDALSSGFRTRSGTHRRTIQASFGGRTERVSAWLDETVPSLRLSMRSAFVLASKDGLFGEGSGLIRLFPPEQYGERHPDAGRPIPLDPSSLVRLHLDGDFLGIYCLMPFESSAPPWFATGARDSHFPDRLHYGASSSSPADGGWLSEEEREVAWRRMLSLLGSDPGFPLRLPEARLLAKRHDAMRENLLIAAPSPGPVPLLGGNPAAFYVTTDLDFAAAGPGLAWRSSDPGTISPEGRVTRPTDGSPRSVELVATHPDGSETAFRFRVMPTAPPLPALFLFFGRPLDKLARTDFVALRIPAGKDPRPEWISGTGGNGAKLRGNTSYVYGNRRSINLKFDKPVSVPGTDRPVPRLLLLSGYADASRLRNALSFDTFRAVSPMGTVRAVPVSWTEVFVNGAYAGVWECGPCLRDVATETFSALYKIRAPYGLWTSAQASAEVVDRVDRSGNNGESGGDAYAPFRDLARFVAESDTATFAEKAPELFDLDELADFFLLLNFTGNEDGRATNQFAGRRAEDGRWILLPWDYDKTFLVPPAGVIARSGLLVSPLYSRLLDEVPGFPERVVRRWGELRAVPLSEEAIDSWIVGHGALLAPCMDEDYRVVPPLGYDGTFGDAVEILRTEAASALARVDRFLAGLSAAE